MAAGLVARWRIAYVCPGRTPTRFDIWAVRAVAGIRSPPVLRSREARARTTKRAWGPDRGFVAFASDDSGAAHIYVTRFQPTGRACAGSSPVAAAPSHEMARQRQELFYISRERALMARAADIARRRADVRSVCAGYLSGAVGTQESSSGTSEPAPKACDAFWCCH